MLWSGGVSMPQSRVLRGMSAGPAGSATAALESGMQSVVSTPGDGAHGGMAPGGIGDFLLKMNEKLKALEAAQSSKEGPLRDENARLRFALGEVAAKASALEVQLLAMRRASPEGPGGRQAGRRARDELANEKAV